jgi:hypothetical protein
MTATVEIAITLPIDRTKPGTLRLIEAGATIFECECLGKADNAAAAQHGNPTRNPELPYGDTPTGVYTLTPVVAANPPHPRMGRCYIPLLGIGGQAAKACALDPATGRTIRTGLAIHATPDNEIDGDRGENTLIPTNGCIRVRDPDMDALIGFIGSALVRVTIVEKG